MSELKTRVGANWQRRFFAVNVALLGLPRAVWILRDTDDASGRNQIAARREQRLPWVMQDRRPLNLNSTRVWQPRIYYHVEIVNLSTWQRANTIRSLRLSSAWGRQELRCYLQLRT